MSLINDALKRARETQQQQQRPAAPAPLFRPADAGQPPSTRPGLLVPAGLIVATACLALILWLVFPGRSAIPAPAIAANAASATPAASTPTTTPVPPAPRPTASAVPATPPPPAVQPVESPASTNSHVAVTSLQPPTPALPKLQGILYRPDRPAAVLDGRTVLVGGHAGEYRVISIEAQSVTVIRAGQTNVLSLAD